MAKRIIRVVTIVLVAAAAVIAASLVIAKLAGGGAYAVMSGSMEPEIKTGSMVYTKKVRDRDLKPGDVITFAVADGTTVTHRIEKAAKNKEGLYEFTTKGDANDSPDAEPVYAVNIAGAKVFSVPWLGFILVWMRTPPGIYVTIFAAVLVLIAGAFAARAEKGK